MIGKSKLRLVAAALVIAVGASGAFAALTGNMATQDNITIKYTPDCATPAQTYTLGSFTASIADAGPTFANMSSTFTVNTGANAPPASLFNCLKLHWYQNVESLPPNDPATYKGKQVSPAPPAANMLPITDPPNGGWDYMYLDGSARTMPDPAYNIFIDNQPWYYNAAGEAAFNNVGNTYTIQDGPAKRGDNGNLGVVFLTYLVGEVANNCSMAGCLQPGQMLLLGGFSWHAGTTSIGIDSTFNDAATHPGNIADINAGLANGAFTGWTAVDGATIAVCCPEPASLAVLSVVMVGLLRRRRAA